MNTSRWLSWRPKEQKFDESVGSEPTKPTKPGFDGFVGAGLQPKLQHLEDVLKGRAVELYVADGDRLFIVADEDDAAKLGEPKGTVYTSAEVRCVIQIADPSVVAEVHRWKRQFDARLRQFQRLKGPDR
jgi:hypothetical protein